MAKRIVTPANGSATGERSTGQLIEEQRQQLFSTLAIIEMARDLAEEEDGNTESCAITKLWRSLSISAERLEQLAAELDCIATSMEVGHV